jgi:GNAT superfamily N-acetyltransferase
MAITLRPPTTADIPECGRILFEAFYKIATDHGFPPDFASLEVGRGVLEHLIGSANSWGVVAEDNGRIVGSNFILVKDEVKGIGPISVDPAAQGHGYGRELMRAVMDHVHGAASVRLVQDAFNCSSMSLYTSLGFDIVEPLLMVRGRPHSSAVPPGYTVRAFEAADAAACNDLCRRVHGFDRASQVHAGPFGTPFVAVRDGRLVAYSTSPFYWATNHAVAETLPDMQALLTGAAAASTQPLWFLLPTRQSELFRWCLANGMRGVKPMSLMSMGAYQDPNSYCWLPSVAY